MLWHCWLGGRKGIRPVKKRVVGCWHSLSLASVKSRLVLPFWYRLTWVVPGKGQLNGCVCVCVLWQLNEARLLINNKNTCCKQRHAFVALYRKFLMNIQPYFCGDIAVWAGPQSNSWSGNNKSTFLRVGIARCPSHRRTNNNKTVTRTRRNHPLTSSFLDTPNYFRGTKSCTLYSGSQMPVQFCRDISQKYLRLN